ncbi:MAG: hypothetical protein M3505_10130, partial [Verrucomicrobiota bacterium]|nr:hypothetical protein [Verrucomicrobiota bacterium]
MNHAPVLAPQKWAVNVACTCELRAVYCLMFGVTTSDDYKPVTWVGRYPVDVTTLLVGAHVALMILTCFLSAFGATAFLNLLVFDNAQVLGLGRFWQIFTYAFVHVPYSAGALLWFAVE